MRQTRRLVSRAVVLTGVALWVLTAGVAQAGPILELERFNGKWKLDWDESDPFDPVMKLLETPWLMRRLAGVVTVYVTFEVEPPECEGCEQRLKILQENPIKNTSRVVVLDGKPRPAKDPLGNESIDRFTWSPKNGLEMVRERILKSGKSARIRERRSVADDLKTMVSFFTVWINGEERATIRRVMRRITK
jgi:hypothetical protein